MLSISHFQVVKIGIKKKPKTIFNFISQGFINKENLLRTLLMRSKKLIRKSEKVKSHRDLK